MNTATWTDSAPLRERALGLWAWPAAVALALLLAIVSGGSSHAGSDVFLLFRLLCLALLAASLIRLITTSIALTEKLALLLIIAAVSLVSLQLVPLPYAVFTSLPGREFVAKVFEIASIPPQPMPLTLSADATRGALLALMPPIAIFLATLTTGQRQRWLLVATILVGSIANVFLGLAQRFEGAGSGLYLYEITNYGSATGFFSNRNNFAMLLCIAIPLTWAATHKLIRMRSLSPPLGIAAGAVMMLIIFMGLAASNSRSGIFLGMLALTLSTLMVVATPAAKGRSSRSAKRGRLSLLAILGGAFIIGQFGMTGILRIVENDPLTDYRTEIRDVTLRSAADYFPIGSGFGTFQSVYGMHETPATMISAYVNHAHNDWLELWLEGGLPAATLMGCFVALFVYQAVRVWNPSGQYAEHVLPRAASVGALVLLLHSLVEFPLRMPALACIFAAFIAML
ncbi:MAG: O-antigen ligase family protein, partial [Alphaproteobacteria bacterium]|nr:O-antigen ligase family protein [Alphaproteobacteria bacterium]